MFAARARPGVAALALAAALGGCASLPDPGARPASATIVADDAAPLMRIAAASLREPGRGHSGVRLLADPADALETRLAMVRRAVASVDVQTFIFASDRSGDDLRRELALAAARGVRVRVLVDDLFATGQDALWSAFASRAGVAVRVFNPLPVRGGGLVRRVALSLHELPRINQRMHNKLFVVDGAWAIVGGRNVADEYFGRRDAKRDFVDLDLVVAGTIVGDLAASFDAYWNDAAAYPVHVLAPADGAVPPAEEEARPVAAAGRAAAADGRVADELAAGRIGLEPASVCLLVDAPSKIGAGRRGEVSAGWLELVRGAAGGALIASPYVVPDEETMASLGAATAAGPVVLVTNSIRTSDAPFAHFAYERRRARLLDAGVEVHEMMPGTPASGAEPSPWRPSQGSFGRLHAKVAVVDRRHVFIGSMNMDRRSALCNTEIAIVVDSVVLADQARALIGVWRDRGAWRLVKGDAPGALHWVSPADGRQHADVGSPISPFGVGRRLVGWLAEGWL